VQRTPGVLLQVNDFERLLLRMWDMHCRGEAPHTFQLEPEK